MPLGADRFSIDFFVSPTEQFFETLENLDWITLIGDATQLEAFKLALRPGASRILSKENRELSMHSRDITRKRILIQGNVKEMKVRKPFQSA